MRLLLVEDDERIAAPIKEELEYQNYLVDQAATGQEALNLANKRDYDLILLDLLLPEVDGLTVCNTLRAGGNLQPILMITALGTVNDRVQGLDAGADDYIVKPFALDELLARVRAMLRRGPSNSVPNLTWGDLILDPATCITSFRGQPIALTPTEYRLLAFLMRNPGKTYNKEALYERLWLSDQAPSSDIIKTYVKLLRRKLTDAGITPDPIETVYGFGYRLKPSQ